VSFIHRGIIRSNPVGKNKVASRRACPIFARVGAVCVLLAVLVPARAQYQRWYDLSEQAEKLNEQGNYAAALPIEQQALQVAQSTWGPTERHVALSANFLGVLEMYLEKFSDAESHLNQALAIDTKNEGADGKDTATDLANLGELYQQRGNYPAAEKAMQQAMAIHEKQLGDGNENVATDANNLALVYLRETKYPDAEAMYKKAVAIDQKLGKEDDLATALGGLGTLYDNLDKYADAEQVFNQALAANLKALGPQHPLIGLSLEHLADAYSGEGKFTDAEQTYAKAMASEEKSTSPDQSTIALIEEDTAELLRDEGKYPQAESLLLQALQNRAKALGPNHPDVAGVLTDLGRLYEHEFRYSDSERAFKQALAIDLKSLGEQNLQTLATVIDLANLYASHGQASQAEPLFAGAVPMYVKILGDSSKEVGDAFSDAGQLMLTEKKFDGAGKMFNSAGQIYQKVEGPQGLDVAKCLDLLGSTAEDLGKHDDAESLHKRAMAIFEKVNGPESPTLTPALEGLGRIYKNEHRYAEAEPMYQRQLKIDQAHLSPNDPALRNDEEDLAALYFAWDKPSQAAPYFQAELGKLIDEFRANAATMSERDRILYFSTQQLALPIFFSFAAKYHDQIPELSGQMYDALLEQKGLIAASAAAMRAAVVASGDPQAVQMLDKLTSDRAQVAALVENKVGDPANYRVQLDQVATEANTLEQELMKRSAKLSQQKAQNAATWRDVQKALKPGESAVELTKFPNHNGLDLTGDFLYVALVVTPDCKEPILVNLGTTKDLETGPMLAYRDDVGQTRGFEAEPAPAAQQGAVTNTSAAYAAFWKPLEPALGASKRVYVSPDGVLNTIPMGLMADSDGKLLMEKVQLRIVNSTKDLLLPAHVAQTKSALVVGNPKFDLTADQQKAAMAELRGGAAGAGAQRPSQAAGQNAAPVTQISNAGAAQFASRGGDLKGGDLNPLPGTQVEVETVDKLLKSAGWQASEYTNDLALKDAVTEAHAPRVVHIATHGFFLSDEELTATAEERGEKANVNEDPMLRSGLFFAGADRVRQGAAPEAGVDDGVLTAFEASQLNLEGTELVVLSACETGLGKQLNSDGVFGLRRGLQEAGADAVMMSMWSVPDKETQELMALFYQKWLGGMEKPEALRQAQLEEREAVRKRYGKDLPFYWGAFVLIGK
jgi:CHAT domain-containing protein/tetratricopeptide (TPR) repeat protein